MLLVGILFILIGAFYFVKPRESGNVLVIYQRKILKLCYAIRNKYVSFIRFYGLVAICIGGFLIYKYFYPY